MQKQDRMLGNERAKSRMQRISTLSQTQGRGQREGEEGHRRGSTPKYLPTGYHLASG